MRIIVTIATLLVSGTIIAAQDADKIITNSIGMKLTLIPAGKFVMGSPTTENERDVEELPHEVTITKPFYLGVYEVTQKQYEKFMGKNPSFFKQAVADLPADQVRWVEAVEFCNRLSNSVDKKKRRAASIACRRRRSGNMPAGPGPKRPFMLAIRCHPSMRTSTVIFPMAALSSKRDRT